MWLGLLLFLFVVLMFVWALMVASSRLEDDVEQERHRVSEAALRALAHFDDEDDPPMRRDEWRRDMPPRPRRRASERDDLSGVSGFDFPPED